MPILPLRKWYTNFTGIWSQVRKGDRVPITGVGVWTGQGLTQTANLFELYSGPNTATPVWSISPTGAPSVSGKMMPQALEITLNLPTNSSIVNQWFFTANTTYQITAVSEVHTTPGTDAGAVVCNLTIDRGTGGLVSGANVLNTSFSLKAAANIVQVGTLVSTVSALQFAAGDRLCFYTTGTLTSVAGVQITVQMIRI